MKQLDLIEYLGGEARPKKKAKKQRRERIIMRRVILESPYRGANPAVTQHNVAYARACLRDALLRGEAPLASYLLYTQPGVLDDNIPAERALGINAGHVWMPLADGIVVYIDRGVSEGMQMGIDIAISCGVHIVRRSLRP